eukprot:4482160-Prymnesium_polylepis.1
MVKELHRCAVPISRNTRLVSDQHVAFAGCRTRTDRVRRRAVVRGRTEWHVVAATRLQLARVAVRVGARGCARGEQRPQRER